MEPDPGKGRASGRAEFSRRRPSEGAIYHGERLFTRAWLCAVYTHVSWSARVSCQVEVKRARRRSTSDTSSWRQNDHSKVMILVGR